MSEVENTEATEEVVVDGAAVEADDAKKEDQAA